MNRDIHIHLKITRKTIAWGGAVLLLFALGYEVISETMTMTTYYPSPAGIYQRLSAHWLQLRSYANATPGAGSCNYAGIAAPCLSPGEQKPKAGQLFFNNDKDQFYYASRDADAADQGTWYKAVSGLNQQTIISGAVDAFNVNPNTLTAQWVYPWKNNTDPPLGTITCTNNRCMRSAIQKIAGLYEILLDGIYCSPGSPDITGNPRLTLYRRNTGGSWINMGTANDDIELNGVGGCGEFHLEGMFIMSPNRGQEVGFTFRRERSNDNVKNISITVARILAM